VVVGAMETTSSYFAWLGAVARRKPFVGWVRTDLDLHLQLLPKWHSFLSQMMYPRCNAVVVPSTGSRDSINRIIPIAGDKLKVINNPVNSEEVILLASQESPAWADAILSKPIILGVGRLDLAQKGFDLLIRAHALVRAQNSDHNLLILGEGPDRAALERLAQALGVKGSVFMPGFVRNPFPFFKAAVAFAAPSRIDGFGRVLLEAMILGTPVIASDASGPTEVLQNGKYGISVPMDNVAMLSTAMHSLLTSVTLREEYSRRSLARAHDLGGKGIAAQWNELLCNLTIHPALRAADAAHTPDFRRCPDSPR
jgi:glycosyltransferase involved in cell wall biosynthesis